MFERQIDDTIASFLDKVIGTSEAITLRAVTVSDIPDSVKRFFSAEAEIRLQSERTRILSSSYFDYADHVLRERVEDLLEALRHSTRFTREECHKITENSVKLLFNYVCRPQWSLKKYIFAEVEHVSTDALLESLSYFSDYEYYRIVFRDYVNQKLLTQISKNQFEEIISLIDEELIKTLDSRKLAHLALPIFTFMNPGIEQEFARVPIEALSIFFDDKNLPAVVSRLEREKAFQSSMTMHDLVMVLGDVDYTAGADISKLVSMHLSTSGLPGAVDIPVPDIALEEDGDEAVDTISDDVTLDDSQFSVDSVQELPVSGGEQLTPSFFDEEDSPQIEQPSEDFTLPEGLYLDEPDLQDETTHDDGNELAGVEQENFLHDLNLPSEEGAQAPEEYLGYEHIEAEQQAVTEESESPPSTEVSVSSDQEAYGFFKQEAVQANEALDPETVIIKYGDLRTLINPSDRRKFIKKIFQKDEQQYERSLDVLNAKPTWREASEHIDEVFLAGNVDMYSRIAVKFTDEIYKRYARKS